MSWCSICLPVTGGWRTAAASGWGTRMWSLIQTRRSLLPPAPFLQVPEKGPRTVGKHRWTFTPVVRSGATVRAFLFMNLLMDSTLFPCETLQRLCDLGVQSLTLWENKRIWRRLSSALPIRSGSKFNVPCHERLVQPNWMHVAGNRTFVGKGRSFVFDGSRLLPLLTFHCNLLQPQRSRL